MIRSRIQVFGRKTIVRKPNIDCLSNILGRRIIVRNTSSLATSQPESSSILLNYNERIEDIRKNELTYYPTYSSFQKDGYVTVRIPEFIERYKGLEDKSSDPICVEGRIHSIRRISKVLYFVDIVQDDHKLQVISNNKSMGLSKEEFDSENSQLCKNDHVSVWGYPVRTKAGELSLRADQALKIVSPFLRVPIERLEHRDKVNANRVMNYIVNPGQKDIIYTKATVVNSIRQYLADDGFLEVQTPIIAGPGTGANAEPFSTNAKALGSDSSLCQLRVAPELWLKKLVISGFDKVFEIGQNFRNEGIDGTHNPEFFTCEFYRSHTDLAKLMQMTEELFKGILTNLKGKEKISDELKEAITSGQFAKYEFIPTLESKTGIPLPSELNSESLIEYFKSINVPIPAQKSPQNLLDTLCGIYIEPLSVSEHGGLPIFIFNQPAIMSPLAKSKKITYVDGREYLISLRFELFINGKEYVNSYEEENSPFEQLKKFKDQVESKNEFEDRELLVPDWEYVKAMEYGLPPTGGWGCGIDRLAMLFSGSERIEQVLPFGSLKDVVRQ